MKRARFREEQMIAILKEAENGPDGVNSATSIVCASV